MLIHKTGASDVDALSYAYVYLLHMATIYHLISLSCRNALSPSRTLYIELDGLKQYHKPCNAQLPCDAIAQMVLHVLSSPVLAGYVSPSQARWRPPEAERF